MISCIAREKKQWMARLLQCKCKATRTRLFTSKRMFESSGRHRTRKERSRPVRRQKKIRAHRIAGPDLASIWARGSRSRTAGNCVADLLSHQRHGVPPRRRRSSCPGSLRAVRNEARAAHAPRCGPSCVARASWVAGRQRRDPLCLGLFPSAPYGAVDNGLALLQGQWRRWSAIARPDTDGLSTTALVVKNHNGIGGRRPPYADRVSHYPCQLAAVDCRTGGTTRPIGDHQHADLRLSRLRQDHRGRGASRQQRNLSVVPADCYRAGRRARGNGDASGPADGCLPAGRIAAGRCVRGWRSRRWWWGSSAWRPAACRCWGC